MSGRLGAWLGCNTLTRCGHFCVRRDAGWRLQARSPSLESGVRSVWLCRWGRPVGVVFCQSDEDVLCFGVGLLRSVHFCVILLGPTEGPVGVGGGG